LGVGEPAVAGVVGGGAKVAGIRAVVFEQVEPGTGEEVGEFAEVVGAPDASQAGGVSEDGAAGLAGGGVDDVVGVVDAPAAEEGVGSDLDAPGMGIVDVGLDAGEVGGVLGSRR
jgi:hypothetical protein